MKALIILIASTFFLSTIPNSKEKDSLDKIMTYKIDKSEVVKIENTFESRIPVIIVKKD